MMRKILLTSFLSLLAFTQVNAQFVNIPDANFKACLLADKAINTNNDIEISNAEAAAFTGQIHCTGLSIADLTGLEAFTSLTRLNCGNNQLTSLDISKNTALTLLFCTSNQLTDIDLSKNTALISLGLYDNQLTSLDVSKNTALTDLSCGFNQLTSLDVSKNTALTYLSCGENQLTSLDVSANTALTDLWCSHNQLTNLDLSTNTALKALYGLSNELTNLDVSTNTALTDLLCSDNQLTNLDVSTNTALINLYCNGNQLTNLDVSTNTALHLLHCNDNQLTSLSFKNGNNSNVTNAKFKAINNPNLTCIQVDNAVWSTANHTNKDATAIFSENCGSTTGINEMSNISLIIYPNPVSDIINIQTDATVISSSIYDLSGSLVATFKGGEYSVNHLNAGVYFIKVQTETGIAQHKFVKQ